MPTIRQTLASLPLCLLLSLAAACGGAAVDESAQQGADVRQGDATAFEPFDHYAAVAKLASKVAASPSAVSLHGVPLKGAANPGDVAAYEWTWTLLGKDGMFVEVSSGPAGNKVLSHEKRYLFAGQATFDPAQLAVNATDALQLVLKAGLTAPRDLQLAATLASGSRARWSVDGGAKDATVDATTGDLIKQ
jgi:hypothetical protein